MATIEPEDQDEFEALMSQIDFGEAGEEEPVVYADLSLLELTERFEDVRRRLADTGEMLDPKTPEAMDLSAIYHGLLLEKKRRAL